MVCGSVSVGVSVSGGVEGCWRFDSDEPTFPGGCVGCHIIII